MTVVGTRPELIKLSRVIAELDRSTRHVLVHTGQNYDFELNGVFFSDLGIRQPDHFLNVATGGLATTIGNVIVKCDEVFEKEKPDALLLLGDTNSCLSVIPAKRRRIPVFHMEAGNRCFDQRVPEELNRKVVDHLSDINLPYTEHARRYLISEGLRPEMVIKTGSPMKEILDHHAASIERSDALKKLQLKKGGYLVVSAHREENVDSPEQFALFLETLNTLAEKHRMPLIVSTHPRTKKRLSELKERAHHPLIQFLAPLGFHDYIRLQLDSFCVISDSGTLTEEASLLGFPAVMIRNAHERPEGMDVGVVIMSGMKPDRVLNSVEVSVRLASERGRRPWIVPDYDVSDVASKVVKIILSYTDYIKRTVWFEGGASGNPS